MAIWQISVFLENKPGELAHITNVLSANKIDLRALTIAETSDYDVFYHVNMITPINQFNL